MTITIDQAVAAACRAIAAMARAAGDEFALMDDRTVATDAGWVFFYNSRDYVETGNPLAALAGNGPIYVDREGQVATLPSAVPW